MLTPKKIAIFVGIAAAVIAGLSLTLFIALDTTDFYKYIVAAVIAIFIIVFIVAYYMLHSFMVKKLTPIYKTIWYTGVNPDIVSEMLDNENLFTNLQSEVQDWSTNKSQELSILKKQAKYRKEFLGNVSHELKTPIFNIQGYVQTLLDGALHDEAVNASYLKKADRSINRMISIVDDLEAISRLESGELKLKKQTFDVSELIKDIFDNQDLRAKGKSITLKFASGADKSHMVHADKEQIGQVLTNLIVNSINYGIDSGETVINFYDMDENLMVEIADNGIGISEKDLPRVFERFYRVDKSRSRVQGGTGLGLAIVKHIIEAHNQTINVSSKLYEGTTFTFTLKKSA